MKIYTINNFRKLILSIYTAIYSFGEFLALPNVADGNDAFSLGICSVEIVYSNFISIRKSSLTQLRFQSADAGNFRN